MKNPTIVVTLAAALLVGVAPVAAEKADRNKPMNIEADSLRYDDAQRISIFTGRVLLTKGSIVIRGGQLEVRQDPDGNQFGLVTGTPDQPAFFRQKREALDEYVEGEGERIEYDGKADTIRLTRKAQLRRYRGTVLADDISGALIVYENQTETFTVDGSAGKGSAAIPGRVRATLTPKPENPGAQPGASK